MSLDEKPQPARHKVPDHVAPELVKTFDFYDGEGMRTDPFGAIAKLHDGLRIFWTDYSTRYGHGSWVVTRAKDLSHVLNNPQLFSSSGWSQTQAITGAKWPLVPIELDGRYHREFRALVMPWFIGPSVERLHDVIRERAASLVSTFAAQGECDFVQVFGRPFPVSIFLDLMGLPQEEMPTFLGWVYQLLHNMDPPGRVAAASNIIKYLENAAEDRRQKPRNDLITRIVTASLNDRPLTDDEVIGLLFTLFLAGLDTVAASLSLHFHHLAVDQALQHRLRTEPALIPAAVEEFLRAFSPVTARRRATEDTEIGGVKIKAGDWVTIPYSLGSLDPDVFDNPMEVDIERKNIRHFAFSAGPHFCLGSHLARRELTIALETWTQTLPPFRLKEGERIRARGGGVFGIDYLPLSW